MRSPAAFVFVAGICVGADPISMPKIAATSSSAKAWAASPRTASDTEAAESGKFLRQPPPRPRAAAAVKSTEVFRGGDPRSHRAVTAVLFGENAPRPAAFIVATRKTYDSPFESPVTVADVDAEVASVKVVQVVPLVLLYCTT